LALGIIFFALIVAVVLVEVLGNVVVWSLNALEALHNAGALGSLVGIALAVAGISAGFNADICVGAILILSMVGSVSALCNWESM